MTSDGTLRGMVIVFMILILNLENYNCKFSSLPIYVLKSSFSNYSFVLRKFIIETLEIIN